MEDEKISTDIELLDTETIIRTHVNPLIKVMADEIKSRLTGGELKKIELFRLLSELRELMKSIKKPSSIHIGNNTAIQINKSRKMEEVIRSDSSVRESLRSNADTFLRGSG